MVYILRYRNKESDVWVNSSAYANMEKAILAMETLKKNTTNLVFHIQPLSYYSR